MPRKTDPRGSNRNRRVRKLRMLSDPKFGGNGTTVPCVHCHKPLDYDSVESDRIIPGARGGTYQYHNVQPSCGPCNKQRGDGSRDQAA